VNSTTTETTTDEVNGKVYGPILFDVNKTTVHRSSLPVIDQEAQRLKEHKGLNLIIDGHADASGSESFNMVLSVQRAKAVKTELTKRGINPNRLKTRGHGSKIPAATNSTTEGKRENRRATMTQIQK
jgi:OOP family OmpA-OmpF porin